MDGKAAEEGGKDAGTVPASRMTKLQDDRYLLILQRELLVWGGEGKGSVSLESCFEIVLVAHLLLQLPLWTCLISLMHWIIMFAVKFPVD